LRNGATVTLITTCQRCLNNQTRPGLCVFRSDNDRLRQWRSGIADGASENNGNCGGMQGIDYGKPGAQAFINSWADELASWGVDYLKLDFVGSSDIPDVQAWLPRCSRPAGRSTSSCPAACLSPTLRPGQSFPTAGARATTSSATPARPAVPATRSPTGPASSPGSARSRSSSLTAVPAGSTTTTRWKSGTAAT
jgi:hypothetical protein